MFLTKYEWIQFFMLYYISCGIEYIQYIENRQKMLLLSIVDRISIALSHS